VQIVEGETTARSASVWQRLGEVFRAGDWSIVCLNAIGLYGIGAPPHNTQVGGGVFVLLEGGTDTTGKTHMCTSQCSSTWFGLYFHLGTGLFKSSLKVEEGGPVRNSPKVQQARIQDHCVPHICYKNGEKSTKGQVDSRSFQR